MELTGIIAIVVILVVILLLIFTLMARLYRKVGPNQALIIYGLGGTRVIKGDGKVIWPMVQQWRELSLELMSFDVAPQQDLYTKQGVAVNVEAVAQIKVKSDPVSILTAAEQFLTKNEDERNGLIRLVMEGHLRGIVGQLTVESIVKDPEMVADRMRSNVAADMAKMGLEVVSFTIREVKDKNDYILNMGKPDIAIVKREADIATANAERDTAIARAVALRESKIAEANAEQERVTAESLSQTKQAESVRDFQLAQASYDAAVHEQRAQADKAYEIQSQKEQQRVVAEQVRVEQVRKEGEIAVQEAEIQRREKELIASVLKEAEIERKRVETLAEADRQRQILVAQGQADAIRYEGEAKASADKAIGLADADVIRARGEAEASAMQLKAAAYQEYNQAAVIDRLLAQMPELVRGFAEPLAKVDKITVVSTGADGQGGGAGINRVTADMASMVAQVPALLESLTGVNLEAWLERVAPTKDMASHNGAPHASNASREVVDAEPVQTEQPPVQTARAAAANHTPEKADRNGGPNDAA